MDTTRGPEKFYGLPHPQLYDQFLFQFPSSRYKNRVNECIRQLDEEERAWQIAEKADTISAWSFFYSQYPQSRRAAQARKRIEQLSGVFRQPIPKPAAQNTAQIVTADGQTGSFTDPRDGNTYKTIKLGGKWWLAENLRYAIKDSYCCQDQEENCKKYGRLYIWEAAKKACPKGWRLPKDEEWKALMDSYEDAEKAYEALIDGGSSGFAALFGGWRSTNGSYFNQGVLGSYWSGSTSDESYAWYYEFSSYNKRLYRNYDRKGMGHSVRCLQD